MERNFLIDNFSELLNRIRDSNLESLRNAAIPFEGLTRRRDTEYNGRIFNYNSNSNPPNTNSSSTYHPVSINRDGTNVFGGTNNRNTRNRREITDSLEEVFGLFGRSRSRYRSKRKKRVPSFFENKLKDMITEKTHKLDKPKKEFLYPVQECLEEETRLMKGVLGMSNANSEVFRNTQPSISLENENLNLTEENNITNENLDVVMKDNENGENEENKEPEDEKVSEIENEEEEEGEKMEDKKDDNISEQDMNENEFPEKQEDDSSSEQENIEIEKSKEEKELELEKEKEKEKEEELPNEPIAVRPIREFPIDPAFVSALPDGIRQEVILQNLPSLIHTSDDSEAASTISSDFLNQLPDNVKNEVIQQERNLLQNQMQLFESFDNQPNEPNNLAERVNDLAGEPDVSQNTQNNLENEDKNNEDEDENENNEDEDIEDENNEDENNEDEENENNEEQQERVEEEPARNEEPTPQNQENDNVNNEQNPRNNDNDTPENFIASLPQNLREDILLTMDEETLLTLPEEFQQEALRLRRRQPNFGLDFDRRGVLYGLLRGEDEDSNNYSPVSEKNGPSEEVKNFQLTHGRKGNFILNDVEINTILKCLYFSKNYPRNQICELLLECSKIEKERYSLFFSLLGILMYNIDKTIFNLGLVSQNLIREKNFATKNSFKEVIWNNKKDFVPKIVVERVLDILKYLLNHNNRFVNMFLKNKRNFKLCPVEMVIKYFTVATVDSEKEEDINNDLKKSNNIIVEKHYINVIIEILLIVYEFAITYNKNLEYRIKNLHEEIDINGKIKPMFENLETMYREKYKEREEKRTDKKIELKTNENGEETMSIKEIDCDWSHDECEIEFELSKEEKEINRLVELKEIEDDTKDEIKKINNWKMKIKTGDMSKTDEKKKSPKNKRNKILEKKLKFLEEVKQIKKKELTLQNEKIKKDTHKLKGKKEKLWKRILRITDIKIIENFMKIIIHPNCSRSVSKECIKLLDYVGKLDPSKRKVILKNLCETIQKEAKFINFSDSTDLKREIRFCRLIQSYSEIYGNVKLAMKKGNKEDDKLISSKMDVDNQGNDEKKSETEISELQFFLSDSLDKVWMNLNFMLHRQDLDFTVPNQETSKIIPVIQSFFSYHLMFLKKEEEKKLKKVGREIELKNVDFISTPTPLESTGMTPFGELSLAEKVEKFLRENKDVLNNIVEMNPTFLQENEFKVLLDYPQYLSFENKVSWFRNEIKLDKAKNGHEHRVIRIKVRRENIFQDTFYQLSNYNPNDLKGKIEVTFVGEAGVDAGGLTREFFLLLSQKLISPKYGLFSPSADGTTYQPNPNSGFEPEHLIHFKFVARVIAMAMYNQQLLDCYFTRSFYKHILGKRISVQDLESIDPEYYKNLKWILDNDINGVFDDLNFALEVDKLGKVSTVELKKNGKIIKVTNENKKEYVLLVTQQKMTNLIEQQLKAFLEGFYEIIPKELIQIFNSEELELLMNGLHEFDVDDLRLNTEYKGGYTKDSRVIKYFWSWLYTLKRNEKAKFLQFVTGTSKVPIGGFKNLLGANGEQKMSIHKVPGVTDLLPTSHTCFNQLDLPEYESYDSLERLCNIAIKEGNQGFGFV